MVFIYIVIGALIFLISWIWASSYFKRKEKERLESFNHKISSIIENKREVHSGGSFYEENKALIIPIKSFHTTIKSLNETLDALKDKYVRTETENRKLESDLNNVKKILSEKHDLYIKFKYYKDDLKKHRELINQKIQEAAKNDKLTLNSSDFKKEYYNLIQISNTKHFYYEKTNKEDLKNETALEANLKERTSKFYSDYILSQYLISEKYLKNKYKPALNEVKRISELRKKTESIIKESRQIEYRNEQLVNAIIKKDNLLKNILQKSNKNIPEIASLYSDFLLLQYKISETVLLKKNRPAYLEVERIGELRKRTKTYIQRFKEMQYNYESFLELFPELNEYIDNFLSLNNYSKFEQLEENFDGVKFYIDREEYKILSPDKRNQLALDRYLEGRKSRWQIGRDYELFCGQEYEKEGWDVEYIGMEKKLKDLGRDLIAKKDNEVHIIQCKYWSQNKTIHEKHIAQLFGTAIVYEIENSFNSLFQNKIVPVFMTNAKLSEMAEKFCKRLGVLLIKKEIKEFPRIKCNINGSEKIYHLPFDQQYDRTQIKNEGEFYAFTVNEAVKKGFRRALRHYPN